MRNSRKWISILAVIAVTICLLIVLDFLLYPCTFTRNDIHKVTTESFDDLYVGASHGMANIDPASVEKVTGRTGHNLCVGGEYSMDVYYMTKLVLEKGHKPKRLVYEISPDYFAKEKDEGNNYLLFYHEFPLTRAKLSYFRDAIARANLRTMFFPWYEYPLSEELKRIPETAGKKWNRDYSTESFRGSKQAYHENGFVEYFPQDTEDPELFTLDKDAEVFPGDLLETNLDYLDRLIKLCDQHDIEFVAILTPLPDETLEAYSDGYAALHQYYVKYFGSRNVRFINFNDKKHYDLTDHARKYYVDLDGHMHGNAARAFSQILAAQLDPDQAGEITWDEVIREYELEEEDDGLVG